MENIYKQTGILYSLSPEALTKLEKYDFPGNIRELINIIRFSTLKCSDKANIIHANDINDSFVCSDKQIDVYEKEFSIKIEELLLKYGYNTEGKKRAAKDLGISLATLYNKMKLYGIKTKRH